MLCAAANRVLKMLSSCGRIGMSLAWGSALLGFEPDTLCLARARLVVAKQGFDTQCALGSARKSSLKRLPQGCQTRGFLIHITAFSCTVVHFTIH